MLGPNSAEYRSAHASATDWILGWTDATTDSRDMLKTPWYMLSSAASITGCTLRHHQHGVRLGNGETCDIHSDEGVECALERMDCVLRSVQISPHVLVHTTKGGSCLASPVSVRCREEPAIFVSTKNDRKCQTRTSLMAVSSSILRCRSSKMPVWTMPSPFAAMLLRNKESSCGWK